MERAGSDCIEVSGLFGLAGCEGSDKIDLRAIRVFGMRVGEHFVSDPVVVDERHLAAGAHGQTFWTDTRGRDRKGRRATGGNGRRGSAGAGTAACRREDGRGKQEKDVRSRLK